MIEQSIKANDYVWIPTMSSKVFQAKSFSKGLRIEVESDYDRHRKDSIYINSSGSRTDDNGKMNKNLHSYRIAYLVNDENKKYIQDTYGVECQDLYESIFYRDAVNDVKNLIESLKHCELFVIHGLDKDMESVLQKFNNIKDERSKV